MSIQTKTFELEYDSDDFWLNAEMLADDLEFFYGSGIKVREHKCALPGSICEALNSGDGSEKHE